MSNDIQVEPSTFHDFKLDASILRAIDECGYKHPTPVQARAIPLVLQGKDLIVTAQTGTGKTAAFVLPILEKLLNTPRANKARALVLTPTRELATQIDVAIRKYSKHLKIRSVSILGGMPYHKQIRDLSRPCDLIIATPGRLLDHLQERRVDLSAVNTFILDEAGRMLDMGFIDDVSLIAKSTNAVRQTLFFTATFDNRLSNVAARLLKNPERIEVAGENMTVDKIEQKYHIVDDIDHKYRLLQELIETENVSRAIIFSSTKIGAEDLADFLADEGYAADALHGDMKQSRRDRTLTKLLQGRLQILVATDVAARGIDVRDVTHVFNFDLPKFAEDYVHRIGRTGRAGESGIAISFVSPMDRHHLRRIERFTQRTIEPFSVPGFEAKKNFVDAKPKKKPSRFDFKKKKFGSSQKRFSDRSRA